MIHSTTNIYHFKNNIHVFLEKIKHMFLLRVKFMHLKSDRLEYIFVYIKLEHVRWYSLQSEISVGNFVLA
jgi:hypothetical protein